MKRNVYCFYSTFVFIVLCSCAAAFSNTSTEIALENYEKVKPISELGDTSLMIQLKDCGKLSLITDVDRIICRDSIMYLFDNANDVIVSFDMNGNFLATTEKSKGHGKNEYIHLSDVSLDETTGYLYALCDTPSEIMVFDKDLNIKWIRPIDFMPIEICVDSAKIYLFQLDYHHDNYEILCMDKDKKGKDATVLLSSKIEIKRLMGLGKSLCITDGECWASLPFTNRIYNISKGKIIKEYSVEFQESWYSKGSKNVKQFLEKNNDKVWMIQNFQKNGNDLWFNSNTEGLYCLNIERNKCICYNLVIPDKIPYVSQLIIPQQGFGARICFRVIPQFIYSYLKRIEKKDMEEQEGKAYELAKQNIKEKNAMITLWTMNP